MSAIDASVTETEVDNQIENLRRRCDAALQRRLSSPDCLSPATLIRILSPVIEKYLSAGLMLEEVAKALQEEGFSVTKGHLVRHLGTVRAENGHPPIKRGKKARQENEMNDAPSARGEGVQRNAQASPAAAEAPAMTALSAAPSPAPSAQPSAPRPAPVFQQRPPPGEKEERRPIGVSDEMWAIKPKIDKILKTYPTPDREYPELADARWWTDSSGKRWDVRADEKPDVEAEFREFDRARIIYSGRWRGLMEKWGLVQTLGGEMTPRHEIAENYLEPLTIDLDEIIAKHLD